MKKMMITIGDGRSVEVDSQRFAAFDSLRHNPLFAACLHEGEYGGRDSQEALSFIIPQLAYTESTVFERLYQPMQFRELVPTTSEAGEWAPVVRFEIFDFVGRGKRASGKGRDINSVDVSYSDAGMPVYAGEIGYDYTTQELRETAFLRRPLPELKLRAAMEGYERHLNFVALEGELDLPGLFNNTTVPQGNAPNGGWIAGYAASSSYFTKILQDVNNGIWTVWSNTAYNDIVTDIGIPPGLFNFLCSTYAATAPGTISNKTLLQLLRESNLAMERTGKTPNFFPGYGLDTAGSGGTNRLLFYVKSPARLIMHLPMPLRFLAPQLQGLDVKIPGEYRYSGVMWRYPKSAYYQDGE
jgi:hypothetical protein